MKLENIKKITVWNGRTYKILDALFDDGCFRVSCDGIITHLSFNYVISEVAAGRATIE